MNETPLYPYPIDYARDHDEIGAWRESFRANIACKESIEAAIRKHHDGFHLDERCVPRLIKHYGFKRMAYVLANTMKEKDYDGRFSPANREWSQKIYVPPDREHNYRFAVDSHPAVVDGFIWQFRKEYQALGLFDQGQCEPDSKTQDYEDRVLVLSPNTLKESCWSQENQLWYAHDGFGCSPTAIGRSVRCTCLGDGETTRWDRADFVGILREECLPAWAKEKLEQIQSQEQSSPTMGEMKL